MWLDDLFPKAKFLDALKMVEKAGHKKKLVAARNEWMNERKPKADDDDAEEQAPPAHTGSEPYVDLDTFGVNLPQRPGPGRLIQGNASSERPGTPRQDDFSEDDELYNVTPRARPAPRLISRAEEPEEDELDALMAETEGEDGSKAKQSSRTNGAHEDEGDDLDALIAEAEGQDGAPRQKQQATSNGREVFEDEEAAMREMDGLW
jgi:replication fork protection complex subunit Csm3/Swi3